MSKRKRTTCRRNTFCHSKYISHHMHPSPKRVKYRKLQDKPTRGIDDVSSRLMWCQVFVVFKPFSSNSENAPSEMPCWDLPVGTLRGRGRKGEGWVEERERCKHHQTSAAIKTHKLSLHSRSLNQTTEDWSGYSALDSKWTPLLLINADEMNNLFA